MPESYQNVEKWVAELVKERFRDAEIVSVEVAEDIDQDGDPVLKVRVIFETETGTLDAEETSSFLRYLRPKLSEHGLEQFPIMSFISNQELRGNSAEPA